MRAPALDHEHSRTKLRPAAAVQQQQQQQSQQWTTANVCGLYLAEVTADFSRSVVNVVRKLRTGWMNIYTQAAYSCVRYCEKSDKVAGNGH